MAKNKINPKQFEKKQRRKIARAHRQVKRAKIRQAQGKATPKPIIQPTDDLANRINRSLSHASSKRDYLEKYGLDLIPLMQDLLNNNNYMPRANDNNNYFEIDGTYDGDPRTLFKHIIFKNIPETQETQAITEVIEEEPWSTPENLQKYEEDWHHRSYETLKENNKNELTDIPMSTIERLEWIMNSSSAWKLAGAGDYLSEQVKQNWIDLYHVVNESIETGDHSFIEELVQMIENEDGDTSTIISYANDRIMELLKG